MSDNRNLILFLQPARLGDIIICLPLVKYLLNQKKKKVIWPIWESYYVQVAPLVKHYTGLQLWPIVNGLDDIDYIQRMFEKDGYVETINTAAWFNNNHDISHEFSNYENGRFDQFKYEKADVPFEEKWKLDIKRNKEREESLKNQIIDQFTGKPYIAYHLHGSGIGGVQPSFNIYEQRKRYPQYDHIEVCPITKSVFDWLGILENAQQIVCVDSCVANLIEQLNWNHPKIFITRSEEKLTPTLRNNWHIIEGNALIPL